MCLGVLGLDGRAGLGTWQRTLAIRERSNKPAGPLGSGEGSRVKQSPRLRLLPGPHLGLLGFLGCSQRQEGRWRGPCLPRGQDLGSMGGRMPTVLPRNLTVMSRDGGGRRGSMVRSEPGGSETQDWPP